MTLPTRAKQIGTTCGCRSAPTVPRRPTGEDPTRRRIVFACTAARLRSTGMQIGIGLPNPVPRTAGSRLLEWAQRAEERGFAALATIDRIVYPSFDSLTALAAVAGATTRIGLMTNVLIAPAYPPVLVAKSAASIDQLSGGRFTLGMASGGRADDYTATGRDFETRGRDFDVALDVIRRVTTWGAGWTSGGAPPDQVGPFAERVRAAWRDAGRADEPRLAALNYFSLGDDAEEDSRTYLRSYYGFVGEYAEMIAEGALRSPDAIRDAVRRFEDAGVTELILDPTTASLDQIDRLAD